MLDSASHDLRRLELADMSNAAQEPAVRDIAAGLMMKGSRYYPFAVGNMEDALQIIDHSILEAVGAAYEAGDTAEAGRLFEAWFRASVAVDATNLAWDKVEMGEADL